MTQELRRGVIVDRFPMWLEAIDATLTRLGVDVVHKGTDWTAALRAVEAQKPDLLVTAIDFDDGVREALEAIGEALERHPEMKVITMSARADAATIETTLAGGATAFVMKSAHPDDFAAAVRQVFTTSVYYAHDLRARDLEARRADGGSVPAPPATQQNDALEDLTRRELEILRLVAQGRSNAELARQLWVTEQTVKFHLSNVYRKLGVKNRTQASFWAQMHGLVPEHAETPA